MARSEEKPDSFLKGDVSATAFNMIGNKDCTPWELAEFLTEIKDKNGVILKNLRSGERHNLLHEMVHKGRLSLFIVVLHLGLWKDLTRDRVPKDSFGDYGGYTANEIAKKKKTKKPIEELSIFDKWEESLTPLMRACRTGDIVEIKKILQNRQDSSLHTRDNNGMNALYWAVVSGKKEIVELLLQADLNPKRKTEKEETLLHVASMFGKSDLIDLLVNDKRCQFDPYTEDLNVKSAFDRCAENGDITTLKQFIRAGKKPNETFLVMTAYSGREECVKYCINKLGMNVNSSDAYKRTPLLRACEGSRVGIVRFLLQHEADVKACSSSNRNVFHMICETGNMDLLRDLIKAVKSADLVPMFNQRDRYTGTDLCFLIRGTDKKRDAWHYCEVSRWRCPIFLKRTRAGNVDVAQYGEILKSGWGVNPSQAEMTTIENMFKSRRLDENSPEDMTPLHIASFKGHYKVVELLLKHGAEPNIKDSFGLTPIMLAAAKGEMPIVESLQNSGASLKEISNDNQDILSIAAYNEQDHIRLYLSKLDIFQLSENFVRANVRKVREELSPQKLDVVRQSGKDVKKHVIDTLREFRIDINQYLVDIGSGPVLEATEE